MTDDKDPTPEELEEAKALRQWLEDPSSLVEASAKTIETAALISESQRGLGLHADRHDAILEGIWPREKSSPRRATLFRTSAFLAAAAALILVLKFRSPTLSPTPLPAPSIDLLQAQAEALRGHHEGLDARMHDYRKGIYTALASRYGEPR